MLFKREAVIVDPVNVFGRLSAENERSAVEHGHRNGEEKTN